MMLSLIGLLGGIGHLFKLRALTEFIPGLPQIAILTSIAFIVLGIGIITILGLQPYEKHPQWLRSVRWISIILPGLIGLACLLHYLNLAKFNLEELMAVGRVGPLIPSVMSTFRILLSSLAFFLFLTQPQDKSTNQVIRMYGICSIGFYLIYTCLFTLAGHWLNLPLLYNYMISVPAGLGFLILGSALLIGTLPFNGILLPFFLPDLKTKAMAWATLLLSLLVLAHGTTTIANTLKLIEFKGLSFQVHHLFLNAEFSTVLLATLVALIGLRVVYYRHEALMLAEQNAQVAQALQDSKGLLNRVITGCDDGIWDWDLNTMQVFWNDRTYEILDISKEETTISLERFYNRLVPEDRDHVRAAIAALIEEGIPYHVEYKVQLRSGEYRYCLSRGLVTERDAQGKATRISGTLTDIGILKQTEQALLETTQKLAQSNQDLEQFAAVAAHDLQTPLRKVRTFLEMIHQQSRDKLDTEFLDLIERSRHTIEGMQTLISDLLAFARLSQELPSMEPINLSEIMQKVIQNLDTPIKEKNAQITVGEMIELMGDPVQLTQLMQNLVENALKYQPSGQQPLITIKACYFDHKFCQITVQDNGIGFKSEYAERIFQPFKRLHGKASPYPGTGVGLAICRRITERYGGTIQAQGEVGKGALFMVRLPLSPNLPMPTARLSSISSSDRPY